MALKALMLKKKIDTRRKALDELLKKDADFDKRSAELQRSINEAETDEEMEVVREAVDSYEKEKADHDQEKTDLEEEIRGLEADLEAIEDEAAEPAADPEPAPTPAEPTTERKDSKTMKRRNFFGMNVQERAAFVQREDVQAFLKEVRTCIKEKRALTNVGLTIPEVMLGLIRENILEYSKLYKHVNVVTVAGEGRAVIMGVIPEAVWTDCCANLNELDLGFFDAEIGCWRVGGYFAVCNANIEDSDLDLAAEILTAIGQAIGLALDKAILYGTGTRMPLGVVTRLAQTTQPADYPATARPWENLSATNIRSIAANVTGVELFRQILINSGAAKGRYARGEKVWIMNETTYTAVVAAGMVVDANGAIVAGINGTMPVVGGVIEVLNFIPNNVIIGGYFDLYLLGERAGTRFATSEHVRFLQDQTVMRGTARYDGLPVIAEGFVAIGINGVTPTAAMTFAPDTANPDTENPDTENSDTENPGE